jgi:hypothetical protein
MRHREDITGQVFAGLTILGFSHIALHGKLMWNY